MNPAIFTTHALSASEQFEAWRGWYDHVFDLDARQPTADGFHARNASWKMDGIVFSCVSAPPVSASRTKTLIRRNPLDHWVIALGKQHAADLSIGHGALHAPAKVPFFFSLADETRSERMGDRIQLYLSRDRFQSISRLLDGATGTVLDTPEGKLLADYLLLLERHLRYLPAEDSATLPAAVQAMVSACLAPTADRVAAARTHVDLTLMERVRQAVRRNLRSPSLGPDRLCREAATSRSQLYRLLESEGGVAHYIQRRRLSESFALLCDGSNNASIGKIAELLCFADGSSFSRAFRREFGLSPSDVRAASLAGLPPAAAQKSVGPSRARSFADCLRGF
jgi:AraC-like DNA-binding protein